MSSVAKKAKRKTLYSEDYQKEFDFVRKCTVSVPDHEYKFHCNACNLDLSCATGGVNDIKKHMETDAHKKKYSILKSKFVSEFFRICFFSEQNLSMHIGFSNYCVYSENMTDNFVSLHFSKVKFLSSNMNY